MNESIRKLESGITIIKCFDVIIKIHNKKIVSILAKQRKILKAFKELEQFSETVGLSKPTIYFKINLYNFVSKYLILKKLIQSSHYFFKNI